MYGDAALECMVPVLLAHDTKLVSAPEPKWSKCENGQFVSSYKEERLDDLDGDKAVEGDAADDRGGPPRLRCLRVNRRTALG